METKEDLVFAYIIDGKGGGEPIDWEMLNQWSPEKGTLWIHLNLYQ